ncbi:FecCD family ABC transporter permease [Staphylococcus carnosus]|uniref:FecCD family ABC transporter permease n=1 Tax=Staphylococcus carnosus TaxID=1281 RepID=UPI00081A4016|nr:iron chelate uptake ABC transporter family permease subunit [Staphylococcus carnosus]ANZ32809.1 iron-dicitrate transporter subunit FecD [Staphylococcus carnosus]UTB80172.1 iron-dicitrate transporter subunit FecD [Staphylococcus carnosus]UTB84938.1 iron-dicitrate transporter subunit FecD [Staphylococcus carnosus]
MTKHLGRKYLIVIAILIIVSLFSLSVGAVFVNPLEAIKGLIMQDDFIINEYREPRMLVGLLVGSSIAISGAVIQGVVRNPLASPDVIGITKGASLAAVTVLILFPKAPIYALPVASFIGALVVSLILSYLIARKDVQGSNLALIGLAIGAICMAAVQYLLIRFPLEANLALVWLTGSLFGRNMDHVLSILPWFIVTVPLILFLAQRLDIIHLGDQVATALGTRVRTVKMVMLILAVMLAGSSIAVVGGLSFLGLIAPHIARTIVGHKHIHIITMSGLIGPILIIVSDTLARGIHPPLDIPVGVIIAIVGAPYFIYVLRKM